MSRSITTVEHFIAEQEREHPEATGAFTDILLGISLAAKVISAAVNRAGLIDILGVSGTENVHGEAVQKMDDYANGVLVGILGRCGSLSGMISEEEEGFIHIPESRDPGPYIIAFDPLDGSSNIDVNISVGTIFSVYRKQSAGKKVRKSDLLQPGSAQLAAGYVLYGSSTMLVFTTGAGVHGFTLDPGIGEFLLSYRNMKIPSPGKNIYSINEAYYERWTRGQQRLVERFRSPPDGGASFSARYVGSMVADFHRTLLRGGIFMYPGTRDKPEGKLRLLYEVSPMALICEQAGGRASDGRRRVLDLEPNGLHQRVPTFIGSPELVEMAERFLAED
ncbi:class 1 fructose-bisphosphatase [Candidatus Palauibacter sp.]|uniref:class 1 fructose-bisphosphatase n=1 Tax=Candidatus Palauibacter sp. TaxID=3101350 RepID=UPI003B58CE02